MQAGLLACCWTCCVYRCGWRALPLPPVWTHTQVLFPREEFSTKSGSPSRVLAHPQSPSGDMGAIAIKSFAAGCRGLTWCGVGCLSLHAASFPLRRKRKQNPKRLPYKPTQILGPLAVAIRIQTMQLCSLGSSKKRRSKKALRGLSDWLLHTAGTSSPMSPLLWSVWYFTVVLKGQALTRTSTLMQACNLRGKAQ